MANRRVLVKRRKTARNIRKITRTMQLIANSRFQRAYTRAMAGRPYVDKLTQLVADLTRTAHGVEHPLMRAREGVNRTALVVVSSNRGLCGGYNSHVLHAAVAHLDALAAAGIATDVYLRGKKGINYFRFLARPAADTAPASDDFPRFATAEELADRLIDRFVRGEIAAVDLAFTRFVSAGKQVAVVQPLLPLVPPEAPSVGAGEERALDYDFSPGPVELLGELLPATVRIRLYRAFIDAAVSEQVARMVAMKAATDAAGDMIKRLTREYNRARQSAITMELLDIVGGANALA